MTISAGSNRRARRIQNPVRSIRAGAAELVEQQRGDQESTEHEEHVDAEETAGHTGNAAVVGEHQRDREGANAVQRRDAAATPTRGRPRGAPVDDALGRRDPSVATHW